jgi:nucleoside-diphosphate-sugar epimerase
VSPTERLEAQMRYLITGGAGFIGSHLAEALLARDDGVTILDNLSTGTRSNIAGLEGRARFVQGSVLDSLLVEDLVAESDVVVHLAAAVGVRLVIDRPLASLLTNVRGSELVLEAAHRYRRKVLLASSSEVYGKNDRSPFREDDDRVLGSASVARWGYAVSKMADEVLASAYHRERGLPTIVVRLFNTVGPRQTAAYGMVLPTFVAQAVAGQDLTVHGDGRQSRCFCHVLDVVEGLRRLLEDPDAEGGTFNVGSTEEVTVEELARRVIRAAGSSSGIRFVPYDEAYEGGFEDMRRRVPDVSRIRDAVGWEPRRSLDDIIDELVIAARRDASSSVTVGEAGAST